MKKKETTEPLDAFPKETNANEFTKFGEMARCTCCNINYPIEDRFWTKTDDGTYCNQCAENKYYLVVSPDVFIDANPLLHNY